MSSAILRQPRLRLLIALAASVTASVFPMKGDAAPRAKVSRPSATLTAGLRPHVSARTRSHRIVLTWSIRGGAKRGISFRVYRNGKPIARTPRYTYTDRRVRGNVAYRYRVVAVNAAAHISAASATIAATASSRPAAATRAPSSPPAPMYWGAWIKNQAGEAPWSAAALSSFERNVGKPVSLINWSSPFYSTRYCEGYCRFWPNDFQAVRDHGAIPFFSWNPGPGTGSLTPAAIAAGAQDAYITAWATAARDWGHPFFLRFAWEMNGAWFPWGVRAHGTTPAVYVAMWRHVHDIFTRVGAANVSWVWCPNADPLHQYPSFSSLYPGDAYVDWTCLDGYNGDDPFQSFQDIFASSYDTITGSVAPSKPMLVGETGATETGGGKPRWIADMFSVLPTRFPKIRGLLWFDKVDRGPGGHSDWPIESSPASISAFAAGVAGAQFAGNRFGSIAASPIPPPGS